MNLRTNDYGTITRSFAVLAFFYFLVNPVPAQTWVGGSSNVWDNLANWTPSAYPNSPSAAATFDSSAVTNLFLTNSVTVGAVTFTTSAPSYSIDTSGFIFSIQGAGIQNSSGNAQTFISSNGGDLEFLNNSSANNTAITIGSGNVYFRDASTASTSSIDNEGYLEFNTNATAANSGILNNQTINFRDNATSGSSAITNAMVVTFNDSSNGGSASIFNNRFLTIRNNASLGGASVVNTSTLYFLDNGTAGNSAISNTGSLSFQDSSTAGASTILSDGGIVSFSNGTQGGAARFILSNASQLIIDDATHIGAVTVGSIEGNGTVYIGKSGMVEGSNNLSTTFTGIIDDGIYNGSLTKVGSGILTLTGAGTYDGGTTISAGMLVIDTGGQMGTGIVINNGWLDYVHSGTTGGLSIINNLNMIFLDSSTASNSTIANNSGVGFWDTSTAGSAVITGPGGISFNNNSTAAGANLTVNLGGLYFNDTSLGGTARININGNGFLNISAHTGGVTLASVAGNGNVILGTNVLTEGTNGLSTTISGVISGLGGSLVKDGLGTLTLTGTNTYNGGTAVIGGTLQIFNDNNLGDTAGSLSFNGTTLRTLGTVLTGRSVTINSGGGLVWDSGSFDSCIGGNITGTGMLTKIGNGALTLLGNNNYNGGTAINNGSLLIGSSTGLGAGSVSFNAGTISMVGGPLTVTVGGDYIQAPAGTLTMGVSAVGMGDLFNILGVASLNGSLGITSYGGFIPQVGDAVTLLYAANGISGKFNQWTSPLGTRWYPIYQTYEVLAVALQPSFAAIGLTPNQKSVGTWLDKNFPDQNFTNLILKTGVQSSADLPAIYDLIAPDELTQLYQIGYATAQNHSLLVDQRLVSARAEKKGRAAGFASLDGRSKFAADLPSDQFQVMFVQPEMENRWSVFVNGTSNFGNITGDGNAGGFPLSTSGMTAGLDYKTGKNLTTGVLLGYSQAGKKTSSLEITGGQLGLYGGLHQNQLHLDGLVEAGINSYKTHRPGYGGTANGTTQGQQFSGWLGLGCDWKFDGIQVCPYVSGQFIQVQFDGFTEQGSFAPLSLQTQSQSSLQGVLGVKIGWEMKITAMTVSPKLNLGWVRQFQGNVDKLNAGFSTGESLSIQGPSTGTDGLMAGGEFEFGVGQGLSMIAQYQGVFGKVNYDSQNISAGVMVGF